MTGVSNPPIVPSLSGALGAFSVGNSCATRVQTGAILDISSGSRSCRDPAAFRDDDGTYYVMYSRLAGTHYGTVGTNWTVGIASGKSLTSLTDQGTVIDTTTVFSGTTPSGAAGGLIKSGGVYHAFISATDNWQSIGAGSVYHFTATNPLGPYTLADTALASAANNYKLDNSRPVFYGGQWVMAFQNYTSATVRTTKFATASSLNGPWTIGSSVGHLGGAALTKDGPSLFVIGGRLYMLYTNVDYTMSIYDVSDLTIAHWQGITMIGRGSGERGDADFGCGSVLIDPDGTAWVVYQGEDASDHYVRIYLARLGAQRSFQIGPNNTQQAVSGGFTTNTTKNVTLGSFTSPATTDLIVPGTFAAVVEVIAIEQGTFTEGELISVYSYSSGVNSTEIELYLTGANKLCATQGVIDISPLDQQIHFKSSGLSSGNVAVSWRIIGCHYLPA